MEASALLWPLAITISSMSLAAAYALVSWRWGSRSTPARKRPSSPEPTENSPEVSVTAALAQLAADQAALFSTLEKLTTTVKRLSSRHGMQDLRERSSPSQTDPPPGTSKAELLRHYGMSGKVGPAFAQAQLDIERTTERTN